MRESRSTWRAPAVLLAVGVLVLGVAACGGDDDENGDQTAEETVEQTTEDGAAPAGNPAAGEAIFAQNCSSCHGPTGGGAAAGPPLQEPELAEDRERVLEQIREGGGGMPAFEGQLSDQEIADVGAYVSEVIATR